MKISNTKEKTKHVQFVHTWEQLESPVALKIHKSITRALKHSATKFYAFQLSCKLHFEFIKLTTTTVQYDSKYSFPPHNKPKDPDPCHPNNKKNHKTRQNQPKCPSQKNQGNAGDILALDRYTIFSVSASISNLRGNFC